MLFHEQQEVSVDIKVDKRSEKQLAKENETSNSGKNEVELHYIGLWS